MKVTDATFDLTLCHRGRPKSASHIALLALEKGDCKRIQHNDVACEPTHCSLGANISRLNQLGGQYEYYHEGRHILVVRCLKAYKP